MDLLVILTLVALIGAYIAVIIIGGKTDDDKDE